MHPSFYVLSLMLAAPVLAQGAAFNLYGKACRFGTTTCLTKNDNNFAINSITPPANSSVYVRVTVPLNTTLVVSGFEFGLRHNNSAPDVRIQTELWSARQVGGVWQPNNRLRNGTDVYVSAARRWCPTWFAPVTFNAGQVFYIAFVTPASPRINANATNDTRADLCEWYTRDASGLSPRRMDRWMYRILCGGATPNADVRLLPRLGQICRLHVDNVQGGAAGNAIVVFQSGPRTPFWRVLGLPFDLTAIGATQCDANIGPEFTLSGTYRRGNSWDFDFPIPLQPTLKGYHVQAQWILSSPGSNPANLSTSAGIDLTLGW